MRCEKHDTFYDSDFVEECASCEVEASEDESQSEG
jgi:hypothetical protein